MNRSIRRLTVGLVAVGGLLAVSVLGMASPAGAAVTHPTTSSSLAASVGVKLPRDEAPHTAPTEWWYFNGHLTALDSAGRAHQYGFEYVTFQFLGEAPQPVYIGNLSITDLTRHKFVYSAQVDTYPTPATKNAFDLHTGPWTMSGTGNDDVLAASLPGYALQLRLHSTGPATLHGTAGEIPFEPFGASAYYSFTSLQATGSIVDHGVRMQVRGISWMDHQWGAIDFSKSAGWDWFSIELKDKSRYMLYFIRDSSGRIVNTIGTLISPSGVTHLAPGSFSDTALATWHSPVTDITYSSGWKVKVPGGELTVRPVLKGQELDLRQVQGVAYWEGDVTVQGCINGHPVDGTGYTEINPFGQP